MHITEIIPLPKARYRIYLDEEFAFVLYKGELRLYGIEAGNELPAETYREILAKVLPKRAKMRALHLLQNRRYTEKQLRQKLLQGEYPLDIIEKTVDYLKSCHYLDDMQYARDYSDYHLHEISRKQIRRNLIVKGISHEIIDAIYSEMSENETDDIESKQILRWLEKKKFDKNTADFKDKQRIFAFLYRKGFDIDTIKHFLSLDRS
jgi:regulatory protein